MQKDNASVFFLNQLGFIGLVGLSFVVTIAGLFIPVMEVDASQYALMSLELLKSNSVLKFTDLGVNYLDKPPLLFWLSSASIYVFGNTTLAYKLPSFIAAWASVYFLYKLTLIYYKINIARLAVLLYAGSVAFVLFTNDIRTDTLLISSVILGVWQLAAYSENHKMKHLFWGAIGIGLAMLAKGPIGLVVVALAMIPHLLIFGKIRSIINLKNLLIPIIVLIVLSPMLIGLYQQWGMHGIRFFFWEQSFGRITGENVWKNDASYFYFLHNIAWAFVPFILFLVSGFFNHFIKFSSQKEHISFFGFSLPFIALSFSHYKLPHYIYIVIPFAAILSAQFLVKWLNTQNAILDKILNIVQSIVLLALVLLPLALFYAFSPPLSYYFFYVISVVWLGFCFANCTYKKALIKATFIAFFFTSLVLNIHGYPKLLSYQSSSQAAFYIQQQNLPPGKVYQLNIWKRAFHYYSGGIVQEYPLNKPLAAVFVYTDKTGLAAIESVQPVEILKEFDDFSVTKLSLLFLNPATRNTTLKKTYLIKTN